MKDSHDLLVMCVIIDAEEGKTESGYNNSVRVELLEGGICTNV